MDAEFARADGPASDQDGRTADELRVALRRVERRLEREQESRRKSEAITERALNRIYEADRAKSVFLASISHELRTPLTAIAGFSALLLASYDVFDDEQRTDFVGRISRNADSLHQMIEEILDFARLDQEAVTLRLEPTPLVDAVETVVGNLAESLAPYRLVTDIVACRVMSERRPLLRVLTNVIQNAVQYSVPDSEIRVSGAPTSAASDCYLLAIEDDGPGVPDDERERVFEPFFRGSHAHVIRTHGPGVGLTVARRFVEAMGGRLRVTSSASGGARIELELRQVP